MIQHIFPKQIKESTSLTDNSNLLKKQPLQIGLNERTTTTVNSGSYIILDFNKEMNGGVRIFTFKANNVKVRIRFGESLTECSTELGEKNATNDHANRDFYVELQNYSDMTFGNTGFRYVRLDFYGDAILKSVVAVNHILSKRTVWQYKGNDKLISKIYQTAKRTVDLCAGQDYLWDGVKRDRLVWVGDIHPEMLALTSLYNRVSVLERSLNFVKEQTPLPTWMNNFPTYSLWWIIIVADYYEKTSARDFLANQIEYLIELLNQISVYIDKDGEINYPSYFVDWQTRGKPDEMQGVRAISIIALKKAIFLLNAFNKDTKLAKDVLQRLLLKDIVVTHSKQVAGLKYFAVGLNDDDKELLLKGNSEGISTFMSYYILKAIASFDKQSAINIMKEYYGAMIDKGATTFWEDFDIIWLNNSSTITDYPKNGQRDIHGDFGDYCYKGFRHSLCHGWSAGVLQFIKEEC